MGLFDPPIVAIKKRVPLTHLGLLEGVLEKLHEIMPPYLSATEFGLIEGYVAAVWVRHVVQSGAMVMDDRKLRYIMNSGSNCFRFLRESSVLAVQLAMAVMPELSEDD